LGDERSDSRLPFEEREGKTLVTAHPTSGKKRSLRLTLDSGAPMLVLFKTESRGLDLDIDQITPAWVTTFSATGRRAIFSVAGNRMKWTGWLPGLRVGRETLTDVPVVVLQEPVAGGARFGEGLLPTSLFRSVYFNNRDHFVILNPR
jgi:hypothetical protein